MLCFLFLPCHRAQQLAYPLAQPHRNRSGSSTYLLFCCLCLHDSRAFCYQLRIRVGTTTFLYLTLSLPRSYGQTHRLPAPQLQEASFLGGSYDAPRRFHLVRLSSWIVILVAPNPSCVPLTPSHKSHWATEPEPQLTSLLPGYPGVNSPLSRHLCLSCFTINTLPCPLSLLQTVLSVSLTSLRSL